MVSAHCKCCNVTVNFAATMCDHVLGHRHKAVMSRDFPNKVEEFGRLQYFLDTYLETFPVLGLEYVEELLVGASYRYNCTLCSTELDWQQMVTHITQQTHMVAYITRHHGDLIDSRATSQCLTNKKQLYALAQTIHAKYGRIKISNVTEPPATVSSAHKEQKRTTPPSIVHHCSLCDVSSFSFPALGMHVMSAQHRRNLQESLKDHKPKIEVPHCSPCSVSCNCFQTLSKHVMSFKHRKKMGLSTDSSEVSEVGRLGHFMDTYMQEEPILGLEYIKERIIKSQYKYTCTLCKKDGTLGKIVSHLLDVDHMCSYIKTHHFSMLQFVTKGYNKKLVVKHFAKKILDRELLKENATLVADDSKRREDSVGDRGDTLPSRPDGGSSLHSKRPLPYPEEANNSHSYKMTLTTPVIDDPPLTKRGKLFLEEDLEVLPSTPHTSTDPHYDERHAMEQVTSAVQELQFHNNHQFFEYLANFIIKDSHDAILIQKIIHNCIRALKSFRDELQMQIPALEPEAPSAYTSRIDQEILNTTVKPESPPLATQTLLPTETSNSPSEIIQKNKVTDFFSSLKNLDESDVLSVFQKIAATNPAFQGINIPSVIRYLKDSGRLNAT